MPTKNYIQVVEGNLGDIKRRMKIGDSVLFTPQFLLIYRESETIYKYKAFIDDPGVVKSVVAGANVAVDDTDPRNPIISVGVDIHTKQTNLAVTQTITNGIFSVATSGTGYVKTGETGNLGVDAATFNSFAHKQIYFNGVKQKKGSQVIWQSPTTFQYIGNVYSNNNFEAIT